MSTDHTTETTAPGANDEAETFASREFGFWLYLMTDAIIFALLFATYVVMSRNIAAGPSASELFSLGHTMGETMLLLFSSITFGFASLAVLESNKVRTILWLLVTIALGISFVSMELMEFSGMISKGAGPDTSGFLSAFFTLVGTHGVHVTFGMIGIVVMVGQILTKGFTPAVKSRLFRLGLFWHFLDIVWIGIFSVVYLPGMM